MRNKFCVNCGNENDLVNELCLDCFKKENTLLKHFKEVKIIICNECKSYLHKNSWRKHFSEDIERNIKKITSEIFRTKIVVNPGVKLDEVNINVDVPKKLKVGNGSLVNVNLDVEVAGSIDEVELTENYVVPTQVRFNACNNCKKLGGNYFEAKLQLRPKNDKILKFVQDYCVNRKKLFISKVEEAKYGYDLYLSDQRETRNLGNMMRRKFGGEVKESKKLFGVKEGKTIYRATVLFRLEE
ncbi:MAG: hypothetical protein CMH62_03800 [Nanoarchaeota archaeon]|nr:hypothetical protein [Nanoarchaeota archaeon]